MSPVPQRYTALVDAFVAKGWIFTGTNFNAPVMNMGYVDPNSVVITWNENATQAEKDEINAFVAAWVWVALRSRLLYDIRTDVNNLTAAQKTNLNNDLFSGAPPKFTQDRGSNASSLLVLWTLVQMGGVSTADKNLARTAAAAIYTLDNPNYLKRPTFDPSINVPGDEPVP